MPDKDIGDTGNAGQVLTAVGTTSGPPAFVIAMAQALRDIADLPINLPSPTNPPSYPTVGTVVNCPGGGNVPAFGTALNEYAIKLNNCKTSSGFTLYGGEELKVVQPYTSTSPDNQCPVAQQTINPPPLPPTCTWTTEVKYTTLGTNQFRIFVQTATASGNGAPDAGGEPFPRNAYSFSYSRVEDAEHVVLVHH